MKNLIILLFASATLFACSNKAINTPSGEPTAETKTSSSQPQKPSPNSNPNRDEKALLEQASAAIKSGDHKALMALHDNSESPASYTAMSEKSTQDIIDSASDIQEIKLGPAPELPAETPPIALDGALYQPSVKIVGCVEINYKSSQRIDRIFYGMDEGVAVFMGLSKVGEAATSNSVRLAVSANGRELTTLVNGKSVPSPKSEGVVMQDIVSSVKSGQNEVTVSWMPSGKEPVELDGSLSVGVYDPSGKKLFSQEVPLKGDTGSETIKFDI